MEYVGPIAQLITAIVLAATFVQSFINGRKADHLVKSVADIKEQTDGITAHLVKVTGEAKYAEGLKHGEDYVKRNGTATEEK